MLSVICVAEFRRGYKALFQKSRHTDEQYYEFDYLKQKCNLQETAGRLQPRVTIAEKENLGKKTLLVLHLTLGRYFGRTFQQRMSLTLLTTLTSELQRIVCSRNYGRHCMIQFFRLYLEYIIDVQCVNFQFDFVLNSL